MFTACLISDGIEAMYGYGKQQALKKRFDTAKLAAAGHWKEILLAAGIGESFLEHSNKPCPLCGGRDRFTFDDKFKAGNFYCRHCGTGDGFVLLSRFLKITPVKALHFVERWCGIDRFPDETFRLGLSLNKENEEQKIATHLRIWQQAQPLRENDVAWRYLVKRGIDPTSCGQELRYHSGLEYHDETGNKSHHPALISRMTDKNGIVTAVHRTYLTNQGQKANVGQPKKMTSGATNGAVVQIAPATAVLGIAEGVETALAASELFSLPVWATIGAENLARFEAVPDTVSHVIIFSDNDRNFVGQAAAFTLAKRLVRKNRTVDVKVPVQQGTDWLDVLVDRKDGSERAKR